VNAVQNKLFLFDVDGTLYDGKQKKIHSSTCEALHALKNAGHELVVATGRAYFMLYSIAPVIHLIDHFILINGQHILANHQTIYEDKIEHQLLEPLLESFRKRNIPYGFQSAYCESVSHINDTVLASFVELDLNLPPEDAHFHEKEAVYQMWCFCDEEQKKEIMIENPAFDFIKWMGVGYDVIKKGQSKGKALRTLLQYLKRDPQDVISFGDGDNDIEMLMESGLGIAMGNASPACKEKANYITSTIEEDGIEKALKKFGFLE